MAKMQIRPRWGWIAFWGVQLVVYGALYGVIIYRFSMEGN